MLVTQRIRGLYAITALLQVTVAGIIYWLHLHLFGDFYSEVAQPERYVIYFTLVLMGLGLEAAFRYQTNPTVLGLAFGEEHHIVFRQVLSSSLIVIFFVVATKDAAISRVFLFSFAAVLYVTLLITLHFAPPLLAKLTFSSKHHENTLLIGASRQVEGMSAWLRSKSQLGIRPVGLLTTESDPVPLDIPILGKLEDFETIVCRNKVSVVIIAEWPSSVEFVKVMMDLCNSLGVRLFVVSDLEQHFRHAIIFSKDDGINLLGFREEVLENPVNRMMKRCLDIAVALPVVLLVLPVFSIIVKILQYVQAPGPLIYRQKRSGLQNNSFTMFKFRSMYVGNSSAALQAQKDDPRIFPAGRFLRKFSLDEIPQFLNVLRGEMSVVGPRPHLVEHNEQFARVMSNYHIRAFIKPGITGLAQVRGFRGETKSDEQLRHRIQSDLYYLENWSLTLDLIIILRTAWQMVFPPKTAY